MPNFIQIVFLILSVGVFAFVSVRFVFALIRRIKSKKARPDDCDSPVDNVSQEEKK